MSRLYKVLNKKDCAEMGLHYSPSFRVILAEHNGGHYTVTKYASTWGKTCIVLLLPIILLCHITRGIYHGVRDCVGAVQDTWGMCDRRDIYGENNYINYLKENY